MVENMASKRGDCIVSKRSLQDETPCTHLVKYPSRIWIYAMLMQIDPFLHWELKMRTGYGRRRTDVTHIARTKLKARSVNDCP